MSEYPPAPDCQAKPSTLRPPKDRLRSLAQASRISSLSEAQLRRRIKNGTLKAWVVPPPPPPLTVRGRKPIVFVDVKDLEVLNEQAAGTGAAS